MKRKTVGSAIPIDQWPTIDRNLWLNALKPGGPFDEHGIASHWAEATRRVNRTGYGRWLDFLTRHDPSSANGPPSDRVKPETLKAYITELEAAISPCSVVTLVRSLKVVAKALQPEIDWRWLARTAFRLERMAEPGRNKLPRMVPAQEILNACVANMDRLLATSLKRRIERVAFRDTLMLALLCARPLRIKNFHSLEIGRHLLNLRTAPAIVVPASEVKNKVPLEFSFPHDLLPFLGAYLEKIRPSFNPPARGNRLWLTFEGHAISINEARYRIKLISKRLLGVDICPHLLRDIAATDLAAAAPDGLFQAAALLGHRSPKVTSDYYVRANRMAASRKISAILVAVGRRNK